MRVFDSVHTRRRFFGSVLRRWRLATAVVSALALVAGLLVVYVVHHGWGAAPASDPGRPVAVHVVQGRTVHIPPMHPYQRPPVSWPAAQTATVTVSGALARAGGTPVFVGPAESGSSHTAALVSLGSAVQVSVASRQAVAALGVHGLVFGLSPVGGGPGGRFHVSVDYSAWAHAYGGDYASRLRLVELPACALTTPQLASCRQQRPVTSAAANNLRAERVGGDVAVSGTSAAMLMRPAGPVVLTSAVSQPAVSDATLSGVVLAVAPAPSGSGGDFTAPTYSNADEWVTGGSSGTYSYSYPVQVPPVPGGFEPAVKLGYSSQQTDGLTSGTNPEASWVGDGWDYMPGFIQTDYFPCPGGAQGHAGEWCLSEQGNAGAIPEQSLALNGVQSPIVKDKLTGTLRAAADGGATFASGPNGSVVMTQMDGTTYYFGLDQLPGYASGNATTNSQWTLPVTNPGGSTYQMLPWRLMLDYVVDPHGNAIAYFYNPQSNWYAENGGSTGTGLYTRGGTLAKIWYGFRDGSAYSTTPAAQVTFTTAGGRQDAPADLACSQGGACSVTSPTFWNDQQLTTISTQALAGGSLQPVDSWALTQTLPATNDPLTAPSLWLSAIAQTGQDGPAPVILPATSFSGKPMANRVMTAADTTAGYSPMTRFRLTSVTSPAGGVTTIVYTPSDPACPAGSSGAGGGTGRCYPAGPAPGGTGSDWYNVYAVTSKTVTDTTGGDPPVLTSYTYASPAWRYNTSSVGAGPYNGDEWRGFGTVTTKTGTAPDPVTQTTDTYFQGLSRNCRIAPCSNVITLTSSRGSTAEDANQYAGMVFEDIVYNGAGGSQVSDTIHDATTIATTATSWAGVTANMVSENDVVVYTTLAGGGVRESDTNYQYDGYGRLTEELDVPDTNDLSESTCTITAYGGFSLITEEDTYGSEPDTTGPGATCLTVTDSDSTAALMKAHAVSGIRNTYDNAGNLTQVQKGSGFLNAGTGTCPRKTLKNTIPVCWTWQTTGTGTYDQYGRPLTQADADNRTTTTAYTPASGAEPASVSVTDPMSLVTTTTYDPARNLPLTVTDPAGYQSVKAYDALGRVTSAWTPGNPVSGPAVSTSSYTVSNSAPSYTTQQSEMPGGGYLTNVSISDSLGQVREVQQQTASGGSDITDTSYNSDGWKALVSSPYYASGAPSGTLVSAASGSVPSQTGYVYDGHGRLVKMIAYKLGAETWETDTTYGGSYTTVVPPSGGTSQTTFTDGRNLTTAIYQYHSGVTADPADPASGYDKTTYTYTAARKLAGIRDAAGNAWSYTYDLLGNEMTQSTPDAGTTTSAYDAAGQMTSVTDARGKTTSWTYDSDGRKTAGYDTTGGAQQNAADQLASWTWDTLAKGKLTSSTAFVNGSQYTEQVSGYNTQGQESGVSTVIPSVQGALAGTYSQQYTYAPNGQQTSYTDSADGNLPSETVTTGYDSVGEESSLTGAITYATSVSYTNLGQPLQYTMGASAQPVYITDTWNPQTFRLTEQNTQAGTGQASIDDLHYGYDNSGNVTSEADTPAGASSAADVQCFQNDYLGRLVQAWAQSTTGCAATPTASAEGGAAPYWNAYTYDVTGNLTGIGSTTPAGQVTTMTGIYPAGGSTKPHAISSEKITAPGGTVTSTYAYDTAGHLSGVTGTGQNETLTWNDPGQLTQDAVTPAGGTAAQNTTYIYGAGGTLLLAADPGTTTLYLGDEELSLAGGTVTGTRYYSINGAVIATRTGPASLTYLAGDSQGTAAVAIDAATLNVTHRYYDPYGSPRGAAPASFPAGQKGFVGGTADIATGLTNLGAREYQPALGAFITTDPVLKPYEPTDLNPYAYSQGNPATYSDPTGQVRPGGDNCGSGGCGAGPACNTSNGDFCTYQDDKNGCYSNDSKTFNNCETAHKPKGTTDTTITCSGPRGLILGQMTRDACAKLHHDLLHDGISQGTAIDILLALVTLPFGGEGAEAGASARVFWTGGSAVLKVAEDWAKANGGVTLNMTKLGQEVERAVTGLKREDATALWREVSRDFASGASGVAHVFRSASARLDSIWATDEFKALLENPNVSKIVYHIVEGI